MSDRVRTGTLCLLLGVVLVASTGCGRTSFVGHRYDNFTAYYNTFYNARHAFEEGVKAIERSDDAVDRRYYVDVFTAPGRASNSDQFQNAIDKSADVLRGHPNSKWVDDALLLIGKSYFYQQNFVGAEQKFREVITLGSALEDEARLWLARTLVAAGALGEARDHLVASLAQEDLSQRWEPRIRLALGELFVKQESFAEAADELEAGLESVRDNELEARGWLLLGQVLETLERYEDAVEAYERVSDAHPPYEISYAADVSAVRIIGLHIDPEPALRELRRMQRDDKNFNNRLELAYLNGLIYQAQGRSKEARNQYYEILYDSDGQLGDLRGRVHYALGELHRSVDEDYVLASAHYDTARTALSPGAAAGVAQPQFAPEAIIDADQKAEMFSTFAKFRSEIARIDSLMALGSLEPDEFAERILELRREKARELSEQQRLVEQRQAERGFQDAAVRAGGSGGGSTSNEATGEAGFLFHRDPIRVQESRLSFITRWGERPLAPDWRRSEALVAASGRGEIPDDAVAARIMDNDADVGQNPLPQIDYSDVPRDSLTRAKMRALRALARYELGNVLFLSMNRPDSAATWYRMVIEEDAKESVAQRAYYALAEVQRSLGDSAAARTIYQQVLRDFPESDFAGRVREQLGIRDDIPSDSLTLALEEYDRAFTRWHRGLHREALNEMVSLAAQHRQTEVAPKALLAAGRIFLEWAEQDSLDILDPIPLTVDDGVLTEAGLHRGGDDSVPGVRSEQHDAVEAKSAAGSGGGSTSPDESATTGETAPAPSGEDELEQLKAAEREAAAGNAATPRERLDQSELTKEEVNQISSPTLQDDPAPTAAEESLPQSDAPVSSPADSSDTVATGTDSIAAAVSGDAQTDGPHFSAGLVPDVSTAGLDASQPAGGWPAGEESPPMLAAAEEEEVYLHTLYASIKSQYPTTVYAEQADEMLSALESYRAELQPVTPVGAFAADSTNDAPADSTVDAPADSSLHVAADSTFHAAADSASSVAADLTAAAADSTARAGADSTASTEADSTRLATDEAPELGPSIPSGEASIRGDGGIAEDLGGFTLILGMNVKQEPMEALAAKYAEQGFRTDVVTETVGGTTLYRAALGHFRTMDLARRGLQTVSSSLEAGVQVAPLSKAPLPR